ncbi:hypothetical protein VTI28DRAFT_5823 [Corynascus sepedonium]
MSSSNNLPSSEIARKTVPGSSTSSYMSPTSSEPTVTTGTLRTSEDSRSSSRFESGTASTAFSLSPIEPSSPLFETEHPASTPPKRLQKIPAMPTSPPPPPPPQSQPPSVLTKLGTPPRIPAVTSTQATPPNGRRANRSPSPERPPSRAKPQTNRLQPRQTSPNPNHRGRSVSAQPPAGRTAEAEGPRVVSNPLETRSLSKPSSEGSPPATVDKRKRKSWFPGVRSRANSDSNKPKMPRAWVMSPENQVDYNTAPLVNGEKVPELWNEAGNVLVFLHPKESNRGPCFKIADHIISPSARLVELLMTEMMATTSHNDGYLDVAPAEGPVSEGRLYLPLGNTDLEHLIAARNLFALLTHQPLVGTTENGNLFAAVLQVAGLLRRFNFCSFDGTSFGEPVDTAFDLLMDHTGIADLRRSREKTLEALILAEQMKSWNLYNEAFAHAVGKYESILELKSPLYDRISVSTRQRLDRAHLDLANRIASVNSRLEAFEFPSLFAGTASSTSTEEYKNVRFKEWRNSFGKMRNFVLSYYKGLFGNWPPRARSKKNYFSQSGLNRQCLKILYSDFCALYDLLVDRQSITPRVIGEGYEDPEEDKKDKMAGEISISALRKILSEFDKSSPPVLPPIPFDVPKLPSMTAIYENYHELPAKKQAKYNKALQPHELQLMLIKSRNIDTETLTMPFLLAYKDFELREAKGVNPSDLPDQRIGNWLFLYVVLQSLPMLVVDAPGLHYTEGVEYFLCEAPQGNAPWTDDAGQTRKMWFQTGNSNVVELSADVVMFSVEGTYMRSHCWLAAKEWDAAFSGTAVGPPQHTTTAAPAVAEEQISPLQPPRAMFRDMDPSFTPSHGTRPPSSSSSTNENAGSSTLTTHQHQRNHQHHHNYHHNNNGSSNNNSGSSSPHLRPRSGSITTANDRARQAFRASMAIGLEPLPMPAAPPGFDRTSRVMSIGSLSSGGGGGGSAGPGSPGFGSPGLGGFGVNSGGSGNAGEVYQLGLRASRSAVNLSQVGAGNNSYHGSHGIGGGDSGDYLGAGPSGGVGGGQFRKSSYGGLGPSNLGPGLGPGVGAGAGAHGASDSLAGGSTFDDILKGMDGKEKKKKKLFF